MIILWGGGGGRRRRGKEGEGEREGGKRGREPGSQGAREEREGGERGVVIISLHVQVEIWTKHSKTIEHKLDNVWYDNQQLCVYMYMY